MSAETHDSYLWSLFMYLHTGMERATTPDMASYKVRKSDAAIRPILTACYPTWRGRRVSVRPATQYQMADYWDGGTRHHVVAYDLATGRTARALGEAQIPMSDLAHAVVGVPRGVLLVEHTIHCGRDVGVTLVAHPDDLASGRLSAPRSPRATPAIGVAGVGAEAEES